MQYDMVFEGGGAKGFVFVGAMQEFEKRGHTHGRLLGTSAGAITACLLAAGYRSNEMLVAMKEKVDGKSVFTTFMGNIGAVSTEDVRKSSVRQLLQEINVGLIPDRLEDKLDDHLANMLANKPSFHHLYSFMEYGGWFSADAFITWLTRKLDTPTPDGTERRYGTLTLDQFFAVTQKDLTLIAADTTAGAMLVLNHRTAPKLPVVWAVRMSMSIPLLWQDVVWRKEWGKYNGKSLTGHSIVDGGLLSNFPMELFLSTDKEIVETMGSTTSKHVLGLLIDETILVPGAPAVHKVKKGVDLSTLPIIKRLNGLIDALLSARDKMVMEAFEDCVVRLPALGYGTTEFDMSTRRREAIVAAGRATMEAYFTVREKEGTPTIGSRGSATAKKVNQIAKRMLA